MQRPGAAPIPRHRPRLRIFTCRATTTSYHSGIWVAPKAGTYMVVAVGGGGGGGGGPRPWVGSQIKWVVRVDLPAPSPSTTWSRRAGRRFRISVGKGGTPGGGGSANGGSGGLGGDGGVSSFPGVASADGGTGGPGGPGNSSSTVLAPVGAGRSSVGDMQAPGSAGAATAQLPGNHWGPRTCMPGRGAVAAALRGRARGSGGGAAGASGTIAPGGRVAAMIGTSGGTGSTNRTFTSGAGGGGGGGGGAPGGMGGSGGAGVGATSTSLGRCLDSIMRWRCGGGEIVPCRQEAK